MVEEPKVKIPALLRKDTPIQDLEEIQEQVIVSVEQTVEEAVPE